MIQGYHEYQSIWVNPLAYSELLYFVNKKWEIHTIHRLCMAIKRWLMIPQLQVVGHVPKRYLLINLFDIHIRFYKCVKIG